MEILKLLISCPNSLRFLQSIKNLKKLHNNPSSSKRAFMSHNFNKYFHNRYFVMMSAFEHALKCWASVIAELSKRNKVTS